jgi:hypothetical protein
MSSLTLRASQGNFVPNAAMYRSSAVLDSGCRYDEVGFSRGGEDWDFWLCLAEAGHWGGTALESLFWCVLASTSAAPGKVILTVLYICISRLTGTAPTILRSAPSDGAIRSSPAALSLSYATTSRRSTPCWPRPAPFPPSLLVALLNSNGSAGRRRSRAISQRQIRASCS